MWIWIGIGAVGAYALARSQEKSWTFEGEPRSGHHAGQPVQYAVRETRMKVGVRIQVGVRIPAGVEFRIAREGLLSKLLRRAGVGREVSTGLANFDNTFEVQSEDARLGTWLRESEQARGAISRLFSRRVSRLVAHRGHLWTEVVHDKKGPQAVSEAVALAALLHQVVAASPPARSRSEIDGLALWSRAWLPMLWTYGWTTAAAAAYLGGAFIQYPATVNAFSWGSRISGYALLLSPVLIWLAARWMRDSIIARIVLGEFILIGTAGFVLGAGLLAVRSNSELGSRPIQTSQAVVLRSESVRRRRGSDYYVLFAPFAPGLTEPARVKVSYASFDEARAASKPTFELRWRMGAFGQPVVVEEPKRLPDSGGPGQ